MLLADLNFFLIGNLKKVPKPSYLKLKVVQKIVDPQGLKIFRMVGACTPPPPPLLADSSPRPVTIYMQFPTMVWKKISGL